MRGKGWGGGEVLCVALLHQCGSGAALGKWAIISMTLGVGVGDLPAPVAVPRVVLVQQLMAGHT